jgi:hypothetical protein
VTPTRPQVERLLAGGFRAVLIKCSAEYVWERGGRLWSAEEALAMLDDPTVLVTTELLNAGRGTDGEYTRAQLALLGVGWPPPRGWRSGVKGLRITAEKADEFVELRHSQRSLFGGE